MGLAWDYFKATEGTWGELRQTPQWPKIHETYAEKAREKVAEAGFHNDNFGMFFVEFIATDFPRTTPLVLCTFLHRLATGCYKFYGAPNQMLICSAWRDFVVECREHTPTVYQSIANELSPDQVKTLRRPF